MIGDAIESSAPWKAVDTIITRTISNVFQYVGFWDTKAVAVCNLAFWAIPTLIIARFAVARARTSVTLPAILKVQFATSPSILCPCIVASHIFIELFGGDTIWIAGCNASMRHAR
jgi:hypothetical protein